MSYSKSPRYFCGALLILLLVVIRPAVVTNSIEEITLPRQVDVREGAGAYYPMVVRAEEGVTVTLLEEEDGWVKIRSSSHQGWIPTNALTNGRESSADNGGGDSDDVRDRMDGFFDEMDGDNADQADEDAYASPAQVAAAVRGFSKQYQARVGEEVEVDLSRDFNRRLDRDEYRSFRSDRAGLLERRRLRRAVEIDRDRTPPPPAEVDRVSWAAASRLASEYGLVENYELQKYLNYVGHWIVENSHRYDVPVQVHILDEDQVLAYAIPSGIIMISRGALQLMENEAELAHLIAHEVAHIAFEHGDHELHERQPRLRADEAFAEMEEALNYDERQDEDHVQLVQELTAWADQVYEYIISERLEEYEHEADYYGLRYVARAGYDPRAAVRYLERVKQQEGEIERERGVMEWSGVSLENRIRNMQDGAADLPMEEGNLMTREFQRLVSSL